MDYCIMDLHQLPNISTLLPNISRFSALVLSSFKELLLSSVSETNAKPRKEEEYLTLRHSVIRKILAVVMVLTMTAAFIPLGVRAANDSATFTFTDSGISGSADGAEIDGTTLTITSAGTYTVTGSCSEGSIVVKKGTTGVTLILKDLTLSSSATAPVVCKKTTEVTLDIQGTVTLTDNEDPANEDSADEAVADAFEGAAIKAKDGSTLVIKGSGTLNVNATGCKNGIKGGATTDITIQSGTINVKAAYNGIASDGTLTIAGGTVNVEAGNDGIKSDPDSDDTESKGTLTITGGSVTVSAADDGLKTGYDLILGTKGSSTGPTINITKSNEGIEGANIEFNSGSGTIRSSDDGINAANSDLTNYSYLLTINGGDWTINADGDGLDSNGDLINNGGNVVVYAAANSGNGAVDIGESGNVWTSNGGSILAIGMNGMSIVPNSGTYVSFGTTGMGGGMMPGGNMGGAPAQSGATGGQTPPNGSMNGQTQPAGAAGGMNSNSSGSISIQNGSTIVIKDSSGNTVAEAIGVKNANCVVFASDTLKSGETYTLVINGTEAATATASNGNGSAAPGGNGQQAPEGSAPADPSGSGNNTNTYPANSTPFTDVGTGRWYSEAINTMYAKKIMTGTTATTFEPGTALTRGMLIQMLYAQEGKPSVTKKTTFTDVTSSMYCYDAISWAQANGIAAGYGDGTVGPNTVLTRQEAVQMLYSYARYKGVTISGSKDLSSFKDASSLTWSKTAMQWAYGNTLLAGYEDGTLRPSGTTTRAEMAQIMMRYLQLIKA